VRGHGGGGGGVFVPGDFRPRILQLPGDVDFLYVYGAGLRLCPYGGTAAQRSVTRVLHIITDTNIGGAGHQLLALYDAVDKNSFALETALPRGSALTPLLAKRGAVFYEMPHMNDRSFSLPAVGALYGLMKRVKPHIVHTHAALSGRLAAALRGCTLVHTRHSVFPPRKRFYSRWVNGLSDAVIAVSPAARDNLLAEGAEDNKITVIYNGLPPPAGISGEEKEALRRRYGVPNGAFVLAQIARLTRVKGQDDVLDAAKTLEGVYVLLAGDGENRKHLEGRIEREGITNVRLLGFVQDGESPAHIMDAQVNASHGTEATSLSLLTGMGLGKPAVVSNYGGNPYVIEHEYNGLVYPCRNVEALADGIRRLQTDKDLYSRLCQGAAQRFAQRFTAGEMAARTEALYRAVLA
jgi:glycosyltransferase involved in cell wall biosynthesis